MKRIKYDDGSESVIYERGDRVRLLRVHEREWIAKPGESATILDSSRTNAPLIDSLYIQTDAMKKGGWGALKVPPWFLAPLE